MEFTDLIRLLPTFRIKRTPDSGYTIMVPLQDLLDVFQRNNLAITQYTEDYNSLSEPIKGDEK